MPFLESDEMTIYFLRHGSAGQSMSNPTQDEKRPLDEEGEQQCAMMGSLLAAMQVELDEVLTSPLKRAEQTASLTCNAMGFEGQLQVVDELRPEAEFPDFRALLQKHKKAQAIMVVGHNPSLSAFLSLLLSRGENDSCVALKKGAVARVELDGRKNAELSWCVTPKLLRAAYDSVGTSSRPKSSRK